MIYVDDLRVGDEADWRRLFALYLAFYETTREAAVFAETWRRLHDPLAPMFGLAARLAPEGAPVGIAHGVVHLSTWQAEPQCLLQDLYVDVGVRGGGAGRALIQAMSQAATTRGANRLYWLTHEGNAVARNLYDQVASNRGFIRYERELDR